jgi:hypothetical protein
MSTPTASRKARASHSAAEVRNRARPKQIIRNKRLGGENTRRDEQIYQPPARRHRFLRRRRDTADSRTSARTQNQTAIDRINKNDEAAAHVTNHARTQQPKQTTKLNPVGFFSVPRVLARGGGSGYLSHV